MMSGLPAHRTSRSRSAANRGNLGSEVYNLGFIVGWPVACSAVGPQFWHQLSDFEGGDRMIDARHFAPLAVFWFRV